MAARDPGREHSARIKERNIDKRVVFVRHGLTEANAGQRVQGAEDPLATEGLLQAERLADRATRLAVDHIVSSDYRRAADTAGIITRRTKHPVTLSANFREIAHPSALVGVAHADPSFLAYRAQKEAHWHDPEWHYADEEGFADLLARARRAEDELVAHEAAALLVVTHGNFMKFLTGYLIFKESFSPAVYRHIVDGLYTSNTGLTVFALRQGKWQALTINDHAHLG